MKMTYLIMTFYTVLVLAIASVAVNGSGVNSTDEDVSNSTSSPPSTSNLPFMNSTSTNDSDSTTTMLSNYTSPCTPSVTIKISPDSKLADHLSKVIEESVSKSIISMCDDKFCKAIMQAGDGHENAVSKDGVNIGPLQISEGYYVDAVEKNPSLQSGKYAGFNYLNCIGPGSLEYSKEVMKSYMCKYATEKRLGHPPTYEDMARIHKRGPNGFKNEAADVIEYWEKVKAIMEQCKTIDCIKMCPKITADVTIED